MSANNFIRISKTGFKTFEVTERDTDTGRQIEFVGSFKDAEEALEAARDHTLNSEFGVEGGIEYTNQ